MRLCQCGLAATDKTVAECKVPACRHKPDELAVRPVSPFYQALAELRAANADMQELIAKRRINGTP